MKNFGGALHYDCYIEIHYFGFIKLLFVVSYMFWCIIFNFYNTYPMRVAVWV